MRARLTGVVRLFVGDIDECIYSSLSTHPYMLSLPVVEMAKSGGYHGMYGCTHRSYLNLQYCRIESLRIAAQHGQFECDVSKKEKMREIISNFPTYKAVPRFAEETGLDLIAISMHDDILYGQPGITYDTMVKQLESLNRPATPDQRYLSEEDMILNWDTKNPQLKQIAEHAKKEYPEAEKIELHYIDDKEQLCVNATHAVHDKDWPEGVSLSAFNYDFLNEEIIAIPPAPAPDLDDPELGADRVNDNAGQKRTGNSNLKPNSVFATPDQRKKDGLQTLAESLTHTP